jgi:hypothetical protein
VGKKKKFKGKKKGKEGEKEREREWGGRVPRGRWEGEGLLMIAAVGFPEGIRPSLRFALSVSILSILKLSAAATFFL